MSRHPPFLFQAVAVAVAVLVLVLVLWCEVLELLLCLL